MEIETLPALKPAYTVRPCRLDDVEAVVDLMNICAIKTIGAADETVDQTRSDWQRPNFDQAANQRVVLASDNHIVGWAEVYDPKIVILGVDVYVHPDYEDEGIGEYLMAWCESRARHLIDNAPPEARVVLHAYAFSPDKDIWYSALLRASGLQVIRHFWHMVIDLDVPPPAPQWSGITLKIYDGASDKRPIFAVRRAAFQDHFGHVDLPFEEEYASWLHNWEGEHFQPELWFLAMDGEQIVGVCLCRDSFNGDEDRGWISNVGVLREYRRRGIAIALLFTAFDTFYKMGKKRVGLGVDASSLTNAATLYQRAGMRVDKQFDLYEKELHAGVDVTTH